jgi:hypothetical protein
MACSIIGKLETVEKIREVANVRRIAQQLKRCFMKFERNKTAATGHLNMPP